MQMITLAPCLNDTHTSIGKETCNASSKRWGIYKFWMTTSLCKTGCSYVLHLPISLRKESISMANLTYVILSFSFISRSLQCLLSCMYSCACQCRQGAHRTESMVVRPYLHVRFSLSCECECQCSLQRHS